MGQHWYALIWPLLGIVLGLLFWKHEFKKQELVVPLAVVIPLLILCGFLGQYVATTDYERHVGVGKTGEHFEDWNERVSCSHSEYDKDGNFTGYAHAYDVDYHSAYSNIIDSNGYHVSISHAHFLALGGQWGNKKFVDLHRSYHTNDGDKYVTHFNGNDSDMEIVTTEWRFENRVAKSNVVQGFEKISEDDIEHYQLVEIPKLTGYSSPVILGANVSGRSKADRAFQIWNARWNERWVGRENNTKVIKPYIVVFKGQPYQVGLMQESLWRGGKKNELVVCVGIDKDNKVTWAYTFSWSDNEMVKVKCNNAVMNQRDEPLVLTRLVKDLIPEIEQHWKRKEFSDFEWITVEPPWWMILITHLVSIAATIGAIAYCVNNQYRDHPDNVGLRFRRRR